MSLPKSYPTPILCLRFHRAVVKEVAQVADGADYKGQIFH